MNAVLQFTRREQPQRLSREATTSPRAAVPTIRGVCSKPHLPLPSDIGIVTAAVRTVDQITRREQLQRLSGAATPSPRAAAPTIRGVGSKPQSKPISALGIGAVFFIAVHLVTHCEQPQCSLCAATTSHRDAMPTSRGVDSKPKMKPIANLGIDAAFCGHRALSRAPRSTAALTMRSDDVAARRRPFVASARRQR